MSVFLRNKILKKDVYLSFIEAFYNPIKHFSDNQLYDDIKCIGKNEETIKKYIQIQTKVLDKLYN